KWLGQSPQPLPVMEKAHGRRENERTNSTLLPIWTLSSARSELGHLINRRAAANRTVGRKKGQILRFDAYPAGAAPPIARAVPGVFAIREQGAPMAPPGGQSRFHEGASRLPGTGTQGPCVDAAAQRPGSNPTFPLPQSTGSSPCADAAQVRGRSRPVAARDSSASRTQRVPPRPGGEVPAIERAGHPFFIAPLFHLAPARR